MELGLARREQGLSLLQVHKLQVRLPALPIGRFERRQQLVGKGMWCGVHGSAGNARLASQLSLQGPISALG